MSIKKKIIIAFLAVFSLVLVTIGVLLYYFFSSVKDYSGFLANNIESIIHRKVSIGKVQANFWGGLGLEVSQFNIKDERGEDDIFTAQHMIFGLRTFPLFVRKMVFYRIIVDSPQITLKRDEGGRVVDLLKDILTIMQKEKKASSAFRHMLTPSLSINRIHIRNGEIKSIDRSLPPYPLITTAEDVEIKCIESRGLRKNISFYLACRIPDKGHQGYIKVQGDTNEFPEGEDLSRLRMDAQVELRDFPLQHLWPYYQQFLPFEHATAIVDLDINVSGNPFRKFQSSGYLNMKDVNFVYPRVFSNPLTPRQASISYKLEKNEDSIKIAGMKIRLDECEFKGSFSLSGMKSKDFSIVAALVSNRFLWNNFRPYLPLNIMSPDLAQFLTESIENGWMEIKSASCAARTRDFAKLRLPAYADLIKGKVHVSGFSLNLLNGFIPLKELKGSVEIGKGSLFLRDFSGTMRGSHLERISGTIANLYSRAVLNIKTSGDLYMDQMVPMLQHEKMPERIKPVLKGLTAMNGKAQMDLAISGIRLSGQPIPLFFEGSITMDKAGIVHSDLPLPLADLNGSIPFTDRMLTFKGITGRLGSSTFIIRGNMKDWQEVNPYSVLGVTSEVKLSELRTFSPHGFFDEIDLQGTGYLKVNIDGYFNKTCLSGDLDLTRGRYRFTEWLMKPEGTNNKLRWSVCYLHKKHTLQIDSLQYGLTTTKVGGKGRFQFGDKAEFTASLSTKGIHLAELNYTNLPELKPVGTISGDVMLQGEMGSWDAFNSEGTIAINKAGLKGKQYSKPVFTVSAKAKFDKKKLTVDNVLFQSGDSIITVKGSMQGFTTPNIRFEASSPFLVIDDFINLREKIGLAEEKKEKGKREWIAGALLEGSASVAQGRYLDVTFEKLETKTFMKNGILQLNPLEWKSGEGRAASHLTLDFNWKEHASLASDFTMEKMDVQRAFSLLSMPNDRVAGTLDLKGSLSSQFEEFKEITNTLNGNIKLKLSGGRIQKSTILSRVLTILNLYQIFKLRFDEFIQQGMPYKSIIGTLRMKDGVITTEDLFLDADQIRISAIGTLNLVQDELSLNLAVEPLVTVDKILNNIPIIGKIITGKEKSLVVFYFTVKGKIGDPEVKVTPLKSLTKKVSGILENLLGIPQQIKEMPQKILKPSQKP